MMPKKYTSLRPKRSDLATSMLSQAPAGFDKSTLPDWVTKAPRAKRTIPNKHEESDLQILCCKYLDSYPQILYWATPNSTFIGAMTGAKLGYLSRQKRTGVKKGIPDMCLLFKNKEGKLVFCFAELKSDKGVVSEEQKYYMAKCESLGGFSGIVKSIDDLKALLNRAGF